MDNFEYTFLAVVGLLSKYDDMTQDAQYSGCISHHVYKMDVDTIIDKANITDKQRNIVVMHYIEGYTQEEIAKTLGITQQGVFNSLTGVKKRIEKVLKGWNNV